MTKEEQFRQWVDNREPVYESAEPITRVSIVEHERHIKEVTAILKKIGMPEEIRIQLGLPENWQDEL